MNFDDKICPELTEEGNREAVKLLERFKEDMKETVERVSTKYLDEFYTDIMPYIESDSWGNYRNSICDAIRDYSKFRERDKLQAQSIREYLLKNHKEELVNDLNKDLLDRIASLENAIEQQRELNRSNY